MIKTRIEDNGDANNTKTSQTRLLGLDASGNTLTNNLLGISLIYCISDDIDGSTSKFGTNGIDTLMNDVIGDDDPVVNQIQQLKLFCTHCLQCCD